MRWEVLALRYARHERRAQENFLLPVPDPHDAMPMDYFVWVLRAPDGRTIVVDCGFDEATATRRGRTILRPVQDCLRAVGADPAEVADVVVTHLHYDHAGNLDLFPNAVFHLQEREMAFATGKHMCFHCCATPSRWRTWSAWSGHSTPTAYGSMTGKQRLPPECRCTAWEGTRTGCRW